MRIGTPVRLLHSDRSNGYVDKRCMSLLANTCISILKCYKYDLIPVVDGSIVKTWLRVKALGDIGGVQGGKVSRRIKRPRDRSDCLEAVTAVHIETGESIREILVRITDKVFRRDVVPDTPSTSVRRVVHQMTRNQSMENIGRSARNTAVAIYVGSI